MRIALVHELLTMRGGAERVLKILADMYPEAPIYTLLYDEKKLGTWFPRGRVRVADPPFPHSLFPHSLRRNHHLYLNHFPKMVEAWDFSEFDLVISLSSAFVHNIITNGAPLHLAYINSPARYLWDRTHDVRERASKGVLGPLKKKYLERTFHRLRTWDAEASARADSVLAASKDVARRIELYWRRKSEVIYPPIEDFWLQQGNREIGKSGNREHPNYFLIVSTLAAYKNIELAIEACNALKLHLNIAGEGPHRKHLEKLAGPTVRFCGYKNRAALRALYADAQALIFPGIEDFGLAPLEAMASGTPVISYRAGGPLETIIEGETGEFFDEATPQSLAAVLQKFDQKMYSKENCMRQAKRFSRKQFEENISAAVAALMQST